MTSPTPISEVPGWYAVGPKIVVTAGIPSAEAFGAFIFAYAQRITMTAGIPSAEALGAFTVTRGAVQLVPTGIPSEEAFGTPEVSVGITYVSPAGIPSAEAFGTATIVPGPVGISLTGIPSAEAFGTAKIKSNVVVSASIPSAEAFGTPTFTPGQATISPTGIPSAEAFGTPTVLAAAPAVLFDALGAGIVFVSGNAAYVTHTATPGAEVTVWVLYTNTAGVGSIAAQYAGNTMKLEANYYIGYVAAYTWLACFSYPAALAGAQNINLSFGYTSNMMGNSLSYKNANQSDLVKTNGIGPGAAMSVPNVASALRHMVANMLSAIQASAPATAYNQTSRQNITALLLGDAPGAAPNVSFSATQNVAGYWGGLARDMWNASVPVIGAAVPVVTNTIALPPHAIGDLIIIAACDYNSATIPSKPAAGGTVPAWVDIDTNAGANACSMRTACFKATATNHTSGAWGSATYLSAIVVRGQNATSPIGAHAEAGGSSTSVTAPAITLVNNDSQILCFHFCRTVALGAEPAGYKRQGISSDNRFAASSKNDTTTDGATTVTTATAGGWRAAQIEIVR